MVLNFIFLGPPGAGKGSIAQAVADKYGLVQISTGDLIRAEVGSNSDLGKKLSNIMSDGKLVGDDIVGVMIENKLKDLSLNENYSGAIFDGFPRTLGQAPMLEKILLSIDQKLDLVINIESSEENIVNRLSSRWTCPSCKKVYNSITNPPKEDGKCDVDGSLLIQRNDDKPETIKKRLDEYFEKTAPLIDYYIKKNLLKSYDGNVPLKESILEADKIISGAIIKNE
jgi:adenylate kinase